MLRLTRKHRTRVSNRLAVIAAALLVSAAAAGLGNSSDLLQANPELAGVQNTIGSQEATAPVSTNRIKKKFKVSLMLLPRR